MFIPTDGDRSCGFLHAIDVADFIKRVVNEVYHSEYPKVNLSSSQEITIFDLAWGLNDCFPDVIYRFTVEDFIFT